MSDSRRSASGTIAERLAALPCDALGVSGSALCLVHCVATPLLLAWKPDVTWLGGPAMEWALFGGCLLFGALSLPLSYFRCHGCSHASLLYVCGVAALAAGRFTSAAGLEEWLTPTGAALVASAHLWNRRLHKAPAALVPRVLSLLFVAGGNRRPASGDRPSSSG